MQEFKEYYSRSSEQVECETIDQITDAMYNRRKNHLDHRFPFFVGLITSLDYLKDHMDLPELIKAISDHLNDDDFNEIIANYFNTEK